MLKTRTWVLLLAAAAIVLATICFALSQRQSPGVTAVISQDGAVIREIDLSRVTQPYRFTIETADGGTNEIEVEPGSIRVVSANCPDQVCVLQGWLPGSALPIVCMPHGLIIEIRDEGATSGTGADAVAN